jgi:hypothetical protein
VLYGRRDFIVKGSLQGIRFFLVILIVGCIPAFSAYFCYCSLVETDFSSSGPSLENPDQENLLTDYQHKSKASGLPGFPNLSLLRGHHLEQDHPIFLTTPSLYQKDSILRC